MLIIKTIECEIYDKYNINDICFKCNKTFHIKECKNMNMINVIITIYVTTR